jgi:TRAP transporter TAXI family solute receptor
MQPLRTLILGFAAALLAGSASAQTLGMITTSPGSLSHSISTAVSKVLVDHAGLQARVQAQGATPGVSLAAGAGDLAMINTFDAVFLVTGTGDYEDGGPKPDLRLVGKIVPLLNALHVREDSQIRTIRDLKGKRIGSGFHAQKTLERVTLSHLANGGMTYDDVSTVPAPNVIRAADDFGTGRTDAFIFAVGAAKVKEISVKVGGLRVVAMDGSPEAVARAAKIMPGGYALKVKPSPSMMGVDREMDVLVFDFFLSTHKKVPEDVVYKITKAVHDNKTDLASTFVPLREFDPAQMAFPVPAPLEYHPGAIRFYKEAGMWPPKER